MKAVHRTPGVALHQDGHRVEARRATLMMWSTKLCSRLSHGWEVLRATRQLLGHCQGIQRAHLKRLVGPRLLSNQGAHLLKVIQRRYGQSLRLWEDRMCPLEAMWRERADQLQLQYHLKVYRPLSRTGAR